MNYIKYRQSLKEELSKVHNIEFFKNLIEEEGQTVFDNCLRLLNIEVHEVGSVVCKAGHRGHKFYIILKGSVNIFLESITDQPILIQTLKRGQSFGEQALITQGPRLATVICADECTFATLTKEQYKSLLQGRQQMKMEQVIQHLSSVAGFEGFSETALTQLFYCCQQLCINKRHIIYRSGQQPKYLYIIIQGVVRLWLGKGQGKCLIGENEFLGDFEVFYNRPYEYTAECDSQNALIYVIQKKDLMKILMANNYYLILDQIKGSAQKKHESRLDLQGRETSQNQLTNMRMKTEPIESTRMIGYVKKNNTIITDKLIVAANSKILMNIFDREQPKRPVINIIIPRNKPLLDQGLQQYSSQAKKFNQRLKRTASLL